MAISLILGSCAGLSIVNGGIKALDQETGIGSSFKNKIQEAVSSCFKRDKKPLTSREIVKRIVKGEKKRKAARHSLTQACKTAVSRFSAPVVKRVAPVLKTAALAAEGMTLIYLFSSLIQDGLYVGSLYPALGLIGMLIRSPWFQLQMDKIAADPQSTIKRIKIIEAILTIAFGSYCVAKKVGTLSQDLSEVELVTNYIKDRYREDYFRFENQELDKILVLAHKNTAKIPEIYFAGALEELSRHFDIKIDIVPDVFAFAEIIREAIPLGRIKAVIAMTHGDEHTIETFGSWTAINALRQLNKTTHFILESCSAGYPDSHSPAARIARETGLTVIGNAATSSALNLRFTDSKDPSTAEFTPYFRPWRETTTTFIPETDDQFAKRACDVNSLACMYSVNRIEMIEALVPREVTIITDKHKPFPLLSAIGRTFQFVASFTKTMARFTLG